MTRSSEVFRPVSPDILNKIHGKIQKHFKRFIDNIGAAAAF